MFKVLLLGLMKSYLANTIYPKKEKKHYDHYFIAAFVLIALILLMIAECIFLEDNADYMTHAKNLVAVSIVLLWTAVITKLISFWINRKAKQEENSELRGFSNIVTDFLPVAISAIPISIVAYVVWTKVQTKLSGKKEKWKDSLKRLLLY